ncbi:MAG: carboxylating nicotinate-nucleotide diphosphorylase [Bacteroidales bacterium]
MYPDIESLIQSAILEDIGDGDHTSLSIIPDTARGMARLVVKESGILAGMKVAEKVFSVISKDLQMKPLIPDGTYVISGDIAFYVEGPVIPLLQAERLVLNFMQRMSGIATQTNKYVDAVKGTRAKILDTRKTTPNMRLLEKEAVKIGGGENHRFGLYDMILIKDNHIDFAGGITNAIKRVSEYQKKNKKNLKIEIEARSLKDVKEIIAAGGVHRIMLDNFSTDNLSKAVKLINGRYETEASGGITLRNIKEVAECGVDYISVGALTHQIHSLDFSLKAVM